MKHPFRWRTEGKRLLAGDYPRGKARRQSCGHPHRREEQPFLLPGRAAERAARAGAARTLAVPRTAGPWCAHLKTKLADPENPPNVSPYELSKPIRSFPAARASHQDSSHAWKRTLSSSRRATFFRLPNNFPTGRPHAAANRRSRRPRSNNWITRKAICRIT